MSDNIETSMEREVVEYVISEEIVDAAIHELLDENSSVSMNDNADELVNEDKIFTQLFETVMQLFTDLNEHALKNEMTLKQLCQKMINNSRELDREHEEHHSIVTTFMRRTNFNAEGEEKEKDKCICGCSILKFMKLFTIIKTVSVVEWRDGSDSDSSGDEEDDLDFNDFLDILFINCFDRLG